MRRMSAVEAVDLFATADTLGLPLGPAQPAALLEAMGTRRDWEDLKVFGALVTVLSDLFMHPNVHYLSGFFGPLERLLRDSGANIGFAPADFRRFVSLLGALAPRVMATAASPPDADGHCSLSLHAGANVAEYHAAGADPDRLLVVEVSDHYPVTHGAGEHEHRLHVDEIDVLIESDSAPYEIVDPEPTDVERAIADHIRALIPDGATLQTGIGAVPSVVAALLADGDGGDYGIHSEMFTTGLMKLHQAGKVSNHRKGQYDGVSICTFAGGTRELYDWLHDNHEVAFLPVEVVNSPEVISANANMVTINAALSVDIHGQVVADTRSGEQFSGIGGHEDFVAGAGLELSDRSILCLPSTYRAGEEVRSRIVPWFAAGTVITTPRHQVDVIVTEFGAAELQGKTVHQRGEALAAIAHPDFRDDLLAAAERASGGRSPIP
ncbi:MAG TPA: acetyl-CoA hydrolase/transferase C-terminal domain-containing protein [Acidimicrobiales bacterium]|nr:acetyl-CoA hydrolase/transferase C-terminal domain-containing protein [Acidimicrobiales bacterium]